MFLPFPFQALLKKHEALMSDLSAYGSSIQALREQAQSCRVRKDANHIAKILGPAGGKDSFNNSWVCLRT